MPLRVFFGGAAFRQVISFRKTVSDQRGSERTLSDLQRVVAVETCEDSEVEGHLYTLNILTTVTVSTAIIARHETSRPVG